MNQIDRIARIEQQMDREQDVIAKEAMLGVLRSLQKELESLQPRRIAPSRRPQYPATAEAVSGQLEQIAEQSA